MKGIYDILGLQIILCLFSVKILEEMDMLSRKLMISGPFDLQRRMLKQIPLFPLSILLDFNHST